MEGLLTFGELGLSKTKIPTDEGELGILYPLVRGYIHIDGRGRSRTFQAIHAFFRSGELGVIVLGSIYVAYAFLVVIFGTTTAAPAQALPRN